MPRDHDVPDEFPPILSKEDAAQRGDDPPGAFGETRPGDGDLAPGWTPTGDTAAAAKELIGELGRERRPHREDVYPYLLVRAHSPGDRGARPTWPSIPCWESPDILLIDAAYTGPFSPAHLVVSPTAGRRYRVFVRVWNLGLLPAVGVHVRAWFVNPGFFGGDPGNPAYQPHPIGGAMVNLEDRTRPGAMQVVELDRTWDIPADLTGHECLMASVSCPLDPWGGALDANHDRHVGQRNLEVLAGPAEAKSLLYGLGGMVALTGTLELIHGGPAVVPLLRGALGTTRTEFGSVAKLRAPKALRRGVAMGDAGAHLLTMFRTGRGWLVADSARVWTLALELGIVDKPPRVRTHAAGRVADGTPVGGRSVEKPAAPPHPFSTPLATRRVIEKLGPDRFDRLGIVIDTEPGDALLEGMLRLWGLGGLAASDLAAALAEGGPYAHLLRFAHTDPERTDAGGYSVVVIG